MGMGLQKASDRGGRGGNGEWDGVAVYNETNSRRIPSVLVVGEMLGAGRALAGVAKTPNETIEQTVKGPRHVASGLCLWSGLTRPQRGDNFLEVEPHGPPAHPHGRYLPRP